jgi:hypothetical protein
MTWATGISKGDLVQRESAFPKPETSGCGQSPVVPALRPPSGGCPISESRECVMSERSRVFTDLYICLTDHLLAFWTSPPYGCDGIQEVLHA